VRINAGLLASVERIELQDGSDMPASLLVRALDSPQRYRIPVRLVRDLGEETEQAVAYTVVSLDLSAQDLDRYRLEDDGHGCHPLCCCLPEAVVPLLAEQIVVEVQPVRRGIVRLHKGIETSEQVLRVPVAQEEVVIDHIPAEAYDATAPLAPDETIIPVMEERLVVETRRVITAYSRVRKRVVTRQQVVRGQVRREVVTVTEHYDDQVPPSDVPLRHES
jgi:uncharacterized protein (TIGR02271 family)